MQICANVYRLLTVTERTRFVSTRLKGETSCEEDSLVSKGHRHQRQQGKDSFRHCQCATDGRFQMDVCPASGRLLALSTRWQCPSPPFVAHFT